MADLEWFREYVAGKCRTFQVPPATEVDAIVERLARGDNARRVLCNAVVRTMRERGGWDGVVREDLPAGLVPLHMPAVQWALGALIPEGLHPDLDKAVAKGKDAKGPVQGVSQVYVDAWGVSVRNEEFLRSGRLNADAMEFFVKVLNLVSPARGRSVYVASKTVGKAVGFLDAADFAVVAQGWRQVWQPQYLRGKTELLLPLSLVEREQ